MNYFVPVTPLLCDVFGIGDMVGAGVSTAGNIAATAMTNKANREIADENNAAQKEMFYAGQEFNHQEAIDAFNRDIQKMQLEQQYNSPVEQVKRYQEAGLNPAVMMSQGVAGASGNVSAPSPSSGATTPNIPLMSTPHLGVPDFSLVGKVFKDIADAKKTGLESRMLNSNMDTLLAMSNEQLKQLQIETFLKETFGPELARRDIAVKVSEAVKNFNAAFNYAEAGKTEASQRALNDALAGLHRVTTGKTEKESQALQQNIDAFGDRLKSELAVNRSQIKANEGAAAAGYATAENQRAQAKTEDELRQTRKDVLSADKREREKAVDKLQAEIDVIMKSPEYNFTPQEQYEIRTTLVKLREQQLSEAEFNNSFVGRWIHALLVGVSNGAGAGSAAVALKAALGKR